MCWAGHVRTTGCFSVFISIKPSLIPPQWFLLGLFCFFFYFCFLRSVVFAAGVLAAVTVFRNISRGEMLLPHAIRSRAREGETLRSWWAWHKERGEKKEKEKTPAQLEELRGESTQAKRRQMEVEPTERLQIRVRTERRSATDYCL